MTAHPTPQPQTRPPRRGLLARTLSAPLDTGDYVLLHVLLALTGLGAIISIINALWPRSQVAFVASQPDLGPVIPNGGTAGASVRYSDQVLWTLTDPSVADRLLVALPAVFGALVVLAAVVLVWKVVARIRGGHAFTPATVRLVRALALVVTFGGLLWPFTQMGAQFVLVTRHNPEPRSLFTLQFTHFAPFLAGMLLVLLTEVFARGAQQADDLEGLV